VSKLVSLAQAAIARRHAQEALARGRQLAEQARAELEQLEVHEHVQLGLPIGDELAARRARRCS
jgi:nucleotide-binding universal stress UspA family protein